MKSSIVKPWLTLAAALGLMLAVGWNVVHRQWLELMDRACSTAESEVSLLAALVQSDVDEGRYRRVTELIQQWGRKESDVVALRLTLANGRAIGEYQRSRSAGRSLSIEKTIPNSVQDNVRLLLIKDLASIDEQRDRLLWQLGSTYVALAALLILLTRSLVLQRREINALSDSKSGLHAQAEQHRQAEAERNRLISILEATTDLVSTADLQGNISYLNRSGRNMIGVGDKPLASLQIPDIHPAWASELILQEGIPAATRAAAWAGETAVLGRDGSEVPVSQVILSHHDEKGDLSFLSTIMRDISERQRSERVMLRHNRLLRTLAGINAMQMLDQDEEPLMAEICRMLVEESQFRMAWIGLVESNGIAVRPVAFAGLEEGYLRGIDIRCDESPQGYGPTGTAIRLGKTIINPITETNRAFSPWRECALARGFSSSAATPVKKHGRVIGTISVYSGEPDAFGEEDVVLLERLASELGHALEYRSSEQTRRRLESIVNSSHDLIGIADMEGNLQFINRAGLRLVGLYQDEPVEGRRIAEFVHETRQGRFAEEVMPALLTKGYWSGEMLFRNLCTGAAVPTLSDTFILDGGKSHPVNMAMMSPEISERKQTEDALRQSEERLRQAVRVSQIGIFDHDHRSDTLYWSPEQRNIHGWGDDEAISLPAFLETVYPEDREAIEAAVRRAHDSRGDGLYDVEHRFIRRDGAVRWVVTRSQTFFEGEGDARHPVRTVGAELDLTERKNAEEELRKYREHLEDLVAERTQTVREQAKIIDQIHDSVIATDLEGYIQSWNGGSERLFGYSAAEAVGRHIGFLYPEEEQNFLSDQVIASLKSTGAHEAEVRVRRRNGEDVYVHLSLSLLRDEQGNPQGMVGYFMDITRRKHAESLLRQQTQELAALNQELEAFSYSVPHDLRAPLRGIDGFSQALLEDYADKLDETGRDYLHRVRAGTRRMSDLIDDLLKLSRVTRIRMTPAWVDLSAMAAEIVEQFQHNQPDRYVAVNIAPEMRAWGDPGLLRVALENLLNNAWKYTGKQSYARIDFGQQMENQEMVYFVRDNGAGFDMKYAHKLFDAFQRLHHLGEFPGTGIGLATV